MPRKRTGWISGLGMAAMLTGICPAGAALPPYWQRAREIERIVGDQDISQALKSSPIVSIVVTGDDVYEVQSATCRLTVTIVDAPQDETIVGPRQFDLEIGEPQCQ